MWRRALLAAAAVSYLICVLIMSGMQKEDLDVSMLRKLQRYDVNLDDINNEQIRQQCLSRQNVTETEDQEKKIKENYVSTTEYKSTITTNDPSPPVSLNMDNVIKYLAREDAIRNLDETTENSSHIPVAVATKPTENPPKLDMDLLRRYIQLETKKKSFYKLDDNSEITKLGTTINLKTNEGNPNAGNDMTIIDKLIKEYLLKKHKIPTTTEYTTKRNTLDIQNIYQQIDSIIAKDSKIEESKPVGEYHYKGRQNNTKDTVINPNVMSLSQTGPYTNEKRLFESFYNFFNAMNQFRSNVTQPFALYDDKKYSKSTTQKTDKLQLPRDQNVEENNKGPKTNKSKSEKEQDQKSLTPSLVKEIAETVRKVLIKDLRNELAGIYLKTTQRTTETLTTIKITTETSTTTSKTEVPEKNMAIIDKFMDLYEQIKSLKQASFLFRANNESATSVNHLKQPIKRLVNINSAMFMPLGTLQTPEAKVPISFNDNYNIKPILNYNSYFPKKENNRRLPITIQTNSVEIQPLAIPVSKPESLVRQNIVVHPQYRFRARQDHHIRQHSSRVNVYSESNTPTKPKNITYKYGQMKRYGGYNSARYPLDNFQEPKQTEDIIRFRMRDNGNSRFDTDYYEKINFGNDRNGINNYVKTNFGNDRNGMNNYEKTNFGNDRNGMNNYEKNNLGNDRNGMNNFEKVNVEQDHNGINEKHGYYNRNIPRFHERLERVDTESDGTHVASDSDVTGKYEQRPDFPSRHQLSLVDMKRGNTYDDTHFKNFLKTQQKVTDVLERILATRPKTNTPRSVETA